MKAVIVHFRQNRHTMSSNHMIVKVEGCDKREKAEKYVGKKVLWNTGKKDINGTVASAHGNSGAIRVIFETGMPGQAIGTAVKIL
jgi:large subunit ribosomal protein L35Ae